MTCQRRKKQARFGVSSRFAPQNEILLPLFRRATGDIFSRHPSSPSPCQHSASSSSLFASAASSPRPPTNYRKPRPRKRPAHSMAKNNRCSGGPLPPPPPQKLRCSCFCIHGAATTCRTTASGSANAFDITGSGCIRIFEEPTSPQRPAGPRTPDRMCWMPSTGLCRSGRLIAHAFTLLAFPAGGTCRCSWRAGTRSDSVPCQPGWDRRIWPNGTDFTAQTANLRNMPK